MDGRREHGGTAAVELRYRMERAEAAEAVRTAVRSSWPARLFSPVVLAPLAVLIAGVVVWAAVSGGGSSGIGFLAVPVALLLVRPLTVANTLRAARRQGELRVTVTAEGVRVRNETADARATWRSYRGYRESAAAFVLAGQRGTPVYQVLPKRACADGAEVARLRELIAARLPSL